MIKQGIRIGLNNLGIRDIAEANTFVNAHNAFATERFDMVVMNSEIDGTDTTYLLRETRLGRLGTDPFIVGAMLLATTDESRVHNCVNSGADDLLLIPFSPDQIATRLGAFANRRKPFVVTHDYIGPDRRKQARPGATSAAAFTVPNPVQARAAGAAPERYDSQKSQIFGTLSLERIKRLAAGCEWECKTLLDKAREGTHTPEMVLRGAFNLENLISELMERVARDLRHGTENLEALLAKSAEIKNRPSAATIGEFDSLHAAARRIATTYTGG
ncbi:Predicted response regulator receiver [Magnetospirillum sp. LM-5]|uniref:response regulator n=1 Tax=Magnetospirillum sp. LM-5 TaxID=2681466 RepID=UPI001383E2D0|nr:response regulator [Magnetospirillum sp. LM-5]CAA7621263.1 Predicted response regulator receiver [Magnetospirillum sp. LM-5]